MGIPEIVQVLMYTGALGALLLFIVGLKRRWWRMEDSHAEIVAEMNKALVEKDKIIKKLEEEVADWKGIAFASNASLSEFAARSRAARRGDS